MPNVISWFEIPATDVDRATAFYAATIGATFQRDPQYPDNAFFEHGDGGVGGEICRSDSHSPASCGVLVYLHVPNGIADALSRVEAAGGQIVMPQTAIGFHGFIAHIVDTEGNRVGLHSMSP